MSPFLTANEVAPLLRIRGIEVVRLCREGKLRATRPGKTWLILPEDVEAYIASGYNDVERSA